MDRILKPELLDSLPSLDQRAVGSRADLRRLNFVMGHAGILARASRRQLSEISFRARPLRLVELGAGDGTFLLRLARRWAALGVKVEATLLDRQNIVAAETRRAFAALRWSVESVAKDVFDWLDQPFPRVDMVFANLFLHHFPEPNLAAMLRRAAARTNLFIACEPRRSQSALIAALLLPFMGCNAVTRHDAPASVRAGFAGRELSALWPADIEWESSEQPVGLFSHCFIARRHA
jgi:SAM-dependent methyltransferase